MRGENHRDGAAVYRATWIGELNAADPLNDLQSPRRSTGEHYERARLLVRYGHAVLGFLDVDLVEGLAPASLLDGELQRQLGAQLQARPDGAVSLEEHPRPPVSVVVCTRDRADSLRKALVSILATDYDDLEVVVVDNAPATTATGEVVDELGDVRLRYVLESVPGLSRARNRGVSEARGEIIAFTDDDVVVDPRWVQWIARGFARSRNVACVTGPVPPAELETASQAYFDAKVAWSSTFRRRLYDLAEHRGDDPLFPYTAGVFGAGANFAVRRSALADIGPFDEALGAGAPPQGGEDLDFFLRVILSGKTLAFEPSAVVWHTHRRDVEGLRRQMFGYGAGLTAYAFKHLLRWRTVRDLVPAIARMSRSRAARTRTPEPPSAPGLRRAELRGLAAGPVAYMRGRRDARRRPLPSPPRSTRDPSGTRAEQPASPLATTSEDSA